MSGLAMSAVLQAVLLTSGAQPYEVAYEQSLDDGRPLLVLVGADWCPGCQVMKQQVMPRMEQQGRLNRVHYAVVNTDIHTQLAPRLMRGGTIPQLIVFSKTSRGWHREQITGATSPAAVESMINRAILAAQPATAAVDAEFATSTMTSGE
jgi:thiol-disulfide isomerase/thioredoxin